MAQTTDRRVALDRPTIDVGPRDLFWHILEGGLGHLAETDEPAAGLRQRNAYEPAAAFASAARQCHHGAKRHQIAGQVVDRRDRVELRARLGAGEQLALSCRDAADRLHDGIEPAAGSPGPDMAEGAHRDVHQAGAELY